MLRRAAGRPFESTPVVQRLKAAQKGMLKTLRTYRRGTSNLLPDVEKTDYRIIVERRAQNDVARYLTDVITGRRAIADSAALRACWPAALLSQFESLNLPREARDDLMWRIALAAVARVYGVTNCQVQVIETVSHLDAVVLEDRLKDADATGPSLHTGSCVLACAGDHAWLEVQHPGTNESGGNTPTPRPDDLIIDTWSGQRKAPLFREDAVYPASSKYKVLFTIPRELMQHLDSFTAAVRNCAPVDRLYRSSLDKHAAVIQIHKSNRAIMRTLEHAKLPVSSSYGIYSSPPHPLKRTARAAARQGLAEFDGFSAHARHSDIVATRIARDLGMPIREATRYAPEISAIAREMAAEPPQRRAIAGKDEVFDDSLPLQEPQEILAALDGLGSDVQALHKTLWNLEDALVIADAQTKQKGVAGLRKWWRQADVPLPIHALVFDILANDRIGDHTDFSLLAEMLAKLPAFVQSEAMLDRAFLFLRHALSSRRPSAEEAAAFTTSVLPWIEDDVKRYGTATSLRFRTRIQPVLDLACTAPPQPVASGS